MLCYVRSVLFQNGMLINEKTGKCLAVLGGESTDMELRDCTGAPEQKWQLEGFRFQYLQQVNLEESIYGYLSCQLDVHDVW